MLSLLDKSRSRNKGRTKRTKKELELHRVSQLAEATLLLFSHSLMSQKGGWGKRANKRSEAKRCLQGLPAESCERSYRGPSHVRHAARCSPILEATE
jgi:hypothetical protein